MEMGRKKKREGRREGSKKKGEGKETRGWGRGEWERNEGMANKPSSIDSKTEALTNS